MFTLSSSYSSHTSTVVNVVIGLLIHNYAGNRLLANPSGDN